MNMATTTRIVLAAAALAAAGCSKPDNEYKPPPPPEVTVATPITRTLPDTLEVTARTRGVEEVEVRARVKGFLLQKHKDGGERVKEGDLLFTIDPREYAAQVKQAQAELAGRKADLDLAELTLTRVNDAFAQSAAAQFEVDKAEAERDAAIRERDAVA